MQAAQPNRDMLYGSKKDNNKALGNIGVVVERNLWHTCVNMSLTSVCFPDTVHWQNDLIGYCLVCASGNVTLISNCHCEL